MKASLRKIKDQLPKIYIFKKIRMMAEISFAIDFRVISLFLRNMVAKLVKKKKEQRIRKGNNNPLIENQPSDSWDSLHKFRWKTWKGEGRFSIKAQRKQFNFQLKLRHPFSPYFEQIPAEQTATTIHPRSIPNNSASYPLISHLNRVTIPTNRE